MVYSSKGMVTLLNWLCALVYKPGILPTLTNMQIKKNDNLVDSLNFDATELKDGRTGTVQ